MPGGRPRIFTNEAALSGAIDDYFNRNKRKLTICGLALHLDFESRQSFYDYEKDGEFSYTIKKARLRIENYYEGKLTSRNATGAIFALKNFGWKDKTETEISGGLLVNWHEEKTYEAEQKADEGI